MGFLKSDEVKVYPSTRREVSKQFDARPVTEFQLVSLVNRLIDKDGFVITKPNDFVQGSGSWIQLNIHGYYFKIDADQVIASMATTDEEIWAHIWLDNITQLIELFGEDDATTGYSGIYFSNSSTKPTSLPDGTDRSDLAYYNLLVLKKDSNNVWRIPTSSLARFSPDILPPITPEHLEVDEIDGGILSLAPQN